MLTDTSCNQKADPYIYATKPREEYNSDNELIGYSWHYGETVRLEIHIDAQVIVEDNSIVYALPGQCPNQLTVGEVGQKAYNTYDNRSWTCAVKFDNKFFWIEDETSAQPINGGTPVYFDATEYLKHHLVNIEIRDFRGRTVYKEHELEAAPDMSVTIDRELSLKLQKGTYSLVVSTFTEGLTDYADIISEGDCLLFVQ